MKYANWLLLALTYHFTVTNCRSPHPSRSPNIHSVFVTLTLSSRLSRSFNQKAVLLCDITVECPTTGVNYSNIKLTIVTHLIQMFCFNKEPFKDIEYILRLLKLEHLNKTWRRPLIKHNKQKYATRCHPATGGLATEWEAFQKLLLTMKRNQKCV